VANRLGGREVGDDVLPVPPVRVSQAVAVQRSGKAVRARFDDRLLWTASYVSGNQRNDILFRYGGARLRHSPFGTQKVSLERPYFFLAFVAGVLS
jgi:hypothetical protein